MTQRKRIDVQCHHCGSAISKLVSAYNRAVKIGANLFCNQTCGWLHRRVDRPTDQKKAEKREYDMKYREMHREERNKQKRDHFHRTYDPVQAALYRKNRMHIHAKYCQSPEYKEWKKRYDQQFRAKKKYGEFFESSVILTELESMIDRYAASLEQNTQNKSQQRKRTWKNLQRSI